MSEDSDDQLTLPTPDFDACASPRDIVARVTALADERSVDAQIHLRCSACDWRQTLRLPRARPRRIERLLPRVPVRHWVFSLGASAQPQLAIHPRVRTRAARACVAAVFAWLRRAAARAGVTGPVRCGAVSAIHRVGATLEANVHVHALVLDGVYTGDPPGPPEFVPLAAPRRRDLRRLVAELRQNLDTILARAPAPPSSRARVVHRVFAGPIVRPVATPSARDEALIQRVGELDVRAGPPVDGADQGVRTRLCRYVARMPFDPQALGPGTEGRLRYRLHHPFGDGTTHVELSPRALAQRLEQLAAGDWRPPIAYHGVVAPKAAPRSRQLSLLVGDRPPRTTPAPLALRCPRCQGHLDIVGVESAERAA